MPKKNTPPRIKKQSPTAKKLIAASQKQAAKDFTAQWRFLRKIGAYQSKETAAQSRLTASRIRAIKKKMAEIQKQKMYKAGRVISPVQFGARKTKSGKTVFDYHLNDNFGFVRSKKKPSAIEGVKKVGKGYIVEKTKPSAKIRINKKGDIVEIIGKQQRLKRRYSGEDLLKLMRDIENGQIKFKRHDFLVFHLWGRPASIVDSPASAARLMNSYIQEKMMQMSPDVMAAFLKSSYLEIIKKIDN